MSVPAPPEQPASSPPPEKRRGSRARSAAVGLVAAAAVTASVLIAVTPPDAPGPAPVTFDLTDENGRWFDSGLDVFGGRSLAVAVLPRVPAGASGDADELLNLGEADALTGLVAAKGAPLLGDTGVPLVDELNLDQTVAAVRAIGASNPAAAPLAVRAESLLGQLVTELAGLPVDAPVNLGELPVGAELVEVLDGLRGFGAADAAVTVTFTVDPARSAEERNPIGMIAPEGAAGFPYEEAGPFFGSRVVRLDEPGLYVFADTVAPNVLGAVIVDDPLTIGLDFGHRLRVVGQGEDTVVPSNGDLVQQMVSNFFTVTTPGNWQRFSETEDVGWNPRQPPAPVLQYDQAGDPVLVPNLDAYFDRYFGYPRTLPRLTKPKARGVGEVLIDTPMAARFGAGGTLTRIDVEDWTVSRLTAGVAPAVPSLPVTGTGPAPTRIESRPVIDPLPAAGGEDAAGAGADSRTLTFPDASRSSGATGAAGTGAGSLAPVAGTPFVTSTTPDARTAFVSGGTTPLPASPDGKALLATDTLSQTVAVVDPQTNEVVKELPCNAGCQGVTFGAKRGGGFLAYVANSFSNAVQIIDIDPNGDGRITDAGIVGQLTLDGATAAVRNLLDAGAGALGPGLPG